jgi:hypothetical protein
LDIPTIKGALNIIGKLTLAEQESLKTMLLSPAFVKTLNIEDFVAKERFANGRVCPLYGCIHVVRNGHTVRTAHSDMYVRIVASPSLLLPTLLFLAQEKTYPYGKSILTA